MGSRCTLVRWEYREMRAVPVSMTYLMPGTVREVSATFVARTMRRLEPPALKTRCCSWRESRANSGQHLGAAQPGLPWIPRPKGVGRVADLALAGEEHEDVAGGLAGELLDGVAHGVDRVARLLESSSESLSPDGLLQRAGSGSHRGRCARRPR
jgi:hypothetical protein